MDTNWGRLVALTAVLVAMGTRPAESQVNGIPGASASAVAGPEGSDQADTVPAPTAAEAMTEDAPSVSRVDSASRTTSAVAVLPAGPLPNGSEVFPDDIKFLGGVGFPDMKGRESWDNSLAITPDSIVAEFADSTVSRTAIPVTALTQCLYGQAASRHVGAWIAAGVLIAPIALLGILHKSRSHFVTISWHETDGKVRGMYFQVKKNDFRRLLNTVSYRGQIPIQADAKDQKWLLTQGVVAQALPSEPKEAKE